MPCQSYPRHALPKLVRCILLLFAGLVCVLILLFESLVVMGGNRTKGGKPCQQRIKFSPTHIRQISGKYNAIIPPEIRLYIFPYAEDVQFFDLIGATESSSVISCISSSSAAPLIAENAHLIISDNTSTVKSGCLQSSARIFSPNI